MSGRKDSATCFGSIESHGQSVIFARICLHLHGWQPCRSVKGFQWFSHPESSPALTLCRHPPPTNPHDESPWASSQPPKPVIHPTYYTAIHQVSEPASQSNSCTFVHEDGPGLRMHHARYRGGRTACGCEPNSTQVATEARWGCQDDKAADPHSQLEAYHPPLPACGAHPDRL